MSFHSIKLLPPLLDINIIIPVKDESNNIPLLADEIDQIMNPLRFTWECIWVDDGSGDGTLARLEQIHCFRPHHRYISLLRNYGQSAAFAAGFSHALGKIFITMDGDGQNDPRDIPGMLNLFINQGLDMVNGWRQRRRDHLVRKISSRIANNFRNWMMDEQIKDVGCSLRVFRRESVESLFLFKGMHRFLPTLVRLNGFDRIVEVPVNHRPRYSGYSKYGIRNRLWVSLLDIFAVFWMKRRLVRPEVKTLKKKSLNLKVARWQNSG